MKGQIHLCACCELAILEHYIPTVQGDWGECIRCGAITGWTMSLDLAAKELPFKWVVLAAIKLRKEQNEKQAGVLLP